MDFNLLYHIVLGNLPPREYTALSTLRRFKFGTQVDFGLFYHLALEFLKLKVIYIRYDLQENSWEFLVRVPLPALTAAMVESTVSNFDRLS